MPADIWVNIDGVNRQYDKGYVNISGTWREIDKVWINIGGTWREVSFELLLNYVGTAPDLTRPVRFAASATVGNYVIFAGGTDISYTAYSEVNAYTTALVKTTPTSLSTGRYSAFSGSLSSYALIAGGYSYSSYSATVDTYNTSLTRGTATDLSIRRANGASGKVGNYVVFFGGHYTNSSGYMSYSNNIDAYSSSLVRSNPTSPTWDRADLACASVGNYIIFAGGYRGTSSSVVDCYNDSLVQVTISSLPKEEFSWSGASNQNYAIAAGGASGSIYAWNSSLVRTVPSALPNASLSRENAGASHPVFAIFSGGWNLSGGTSVGSTEITYYDVSLVRRIATQPLPKNLRNHRMAVLGDYVFIGGGSNVVVPASSNDDQSKVYVYKIN